MIESMMLYRQKLSRGLTYFVPRFLPHTQNPSYLRLRSTTSTVTVAPFRFNYKEVGLASFNMASNKDRHSLHNRTNIPPSPLYPSSNQYGED
jgi:hypothetical protein